MNDFTIKIKRDPQVQIKIKDLLDKFNRLPHNYQFKRRYDTLIHNVIREEILNLLGAKLVDIVIELKTEISRILFWEKRIL